MICASSTQVLSVCRCFVSALCSDLPLVKDLAKQHPLEVLDVETLGHLPGFPRFGVLHGHPLSSFVGLF